MGAKYQTIQYRCDKFCNAGKPPDFSTKFGRKKFGIVQIRLEFHLFKLSKMSGKGKSEY